MSRQKPTLFICFGKWRKTKIRQFCLTEAGYNIIKVWECKWWKQVYEKIDGAEDFIQQFCPYQKPLIESEMVEDIKT